jgi:hypothetical protein
LVLLKAYSFFSGLRVEPMTLGIPTKCSAPALPPNSSRTIFLFYKFFIRIELLLIPKLDKDTSKKENYRPVSLMNINVKILNKIMEHQIQTHQKDHPP